jgi:flap endonuclease-1
MGIKKMLKFLNSNYPNVIKKVNDTELSGKMIAIDISILLYQVVIAIRNSGADMFNNQGEISSHILGLFNKTINLLKMNIVPIYVFDGKPPAFKYKTIMNRKDVKQKANEKLQTDIDEEEKLKYFKRTVHISKTQTDDCIELLEIMGIPYIIAPEEADSQCAELVKSGLADGVLTEDMDIMTFGANKIFRNLTSYKKDTVEISMEDVLKELQLNYDQFIELCLLFGCDYCDKLNDMKPELIYKYFMKSKNLVDTINDIKKDGYKVDNFDDYMVYKKYFIDAPVKKINGIELKKCDVEKLEKLLVSKYGLVKMRIYQKLQFMNEYNNHKSETVKL